MALELNRCGLGRWHDRDGALRRGPITTTGALYPGARGPLHGDSVSIADKKRDHVERRRAADELTAEAQDLGLGY